MVRLTDHLDMTLDAYHGRKTTTQPSYLELCICDYKHVLVRAIKDCETDLQHCSTPVFILYHISSDIRTGGGSLPKQSRTCRSILSSYKIGQDFVDCFGRDNPIS